MMIMIMGCPTLMLDNPIFFYQPAAQGQGLSFAKFRLYWNVKM